ncbi:MAG: hypothetical protein K1X89_24370, partial [Myxococcaceae bacterium]|nr:hypothetical protein [Myxococcaceae bacterium]
GGGSGSTGGGAGSTGGGSGSTGGGSGSSGGGTASSGGGTASSGGGTASSGGGSSSGDGGITCASTIVMNNFNPAEPQNAFWVDDVYMHVESWSPGGGASPDGGYDVLTQELYYSANPVAPFNGTITPNTYIGCDNCFYFSRGCPAAGDPTFDCNQFFLAQSGSYSVSRADFDGGAFTSEGTTLHFVEWDIGNDEAVANPTCIDVPKYSVDAGWQ